MREDLLSSLGGVLVSSLWQGAIFGAVLMVLLLVVRAARWRYGLACLTLFTMLVWFVVSAVGVVLPARDFTLSQSPVLENANVPAPEILTDSVVKASQQPLNRSLSTPSRNQTDVAQVMLTSETRATFPRFNLQDVLPYVSLLWMIGVALLSLRLLVSVYLLRRYRKESFELSERWVQERLQILVQRMNLKQRIKLLQTNTLTTPAVMGVVKPILLIPSSLVSGLSVQQLDMLLAHELAHIKRHDYLLNILQTLAETLLFYHPVVWWVSRVIRQERENCCDDLALQVTERSAVEYAEALLRLEKSRQGLALAATNGSLLRRVERLLNPPKAGVSVGSSLATLLLVVCLSLTFVVNAVSAQPIQVSKAPYVFNANIAVDPTNPRRIAVTLNKAEAYNCDYEVCKNYPLLYTTNDAGKTWQEQVPYGDEALNSLIYSNFDSQGVLHTNATLNFDSDFATRTYVNQTDSTMKVLKNETPLDDDRIYDSKLFIDLETNTLYLSYLELQELRSGMWSGTPKLRTSTDGGDTWSDPIDVLKRPTWEMNGGRALVSSLFLGENNELAVVWLQEDYVFFKRESKYDYTEPIESAPYSIWVASSSDGGRTFLSPKQIGESWGMIATAYANGTYYIVTRNALYETGEVSLHLLHSKTNGLSWTTGNVSRNVKLYSSFPYEVAPGLSVSPDGTVDVVFYGQTNAPDCVSIPAPMSRQWTDKCNYNVYYTSSKDDGTNLRVFSDPRQLNENPIVGSQFVSLGGMTFPGWFIGIASTNEAAYPVWIGNREGVEGTQAYMMKIER